MNPNPLAALNHFTCARRAAPRRPRRRQSIRDRRFASAPHAPPRALSETPTPSCAVGIFFRRARVSPARLAPSLARAPFVLARRCANPPARARSRDRASASSVVARVALSGRPTDRPRFFRSRWGPALGRWDARTGVDGTRVWVSASVWGGISRDDDAIKRREGGVGVVVSMDRSTGWGIAGVVYVFGRVRGVVNGRGDGVVASDRGVARPSAEAERRMMDGG